MKHFYALISLLVVSSISNAQTVSSHVAKCEADAYSKIGLQVDNNATIEYLEKKYELVRVCLVGNGLRFNSSAFAAPLLAMREQVFRRYGIWTESPSSDKYRRYIDQANLEIERQTTIAKMSAAYWQR